MVYRSHFGMAEAMVVVVVELAEDELEILALAAAAVFSILICLFLPSASISGPRLNEWQT